MLNVLWGCALCVAASEHEPLLLCSSVKTTPTRLKSQNLHNDSVLMILTYWY